MRYHFINENNEEELDKDADFICDYCYEEKTFFELEHIKAKDDNCDFMTQLDIKCKNCYEKT